jgi:formate/nitrite transporter
MVQYRSRAFTALSLLVASSAFQAPRQSFISQRPLYSTLERPVEVVSEPVVSPPKAEIAPAKTTTAAIADLDLSKVSNVYTPAEAFQALVDKGAYNAASSPERLLFSSALGGCYVGMGAMVSLAVAGNSAGLAAADPGLQKFIFAALFPMNLLLVQQCGGMLYTGNTASMMAAVCEKRVSWNDMGRVLLLSWMGNLFGCALFAIACKYAGVMEGGAGALAAKTLFAKTSADLAPVLIKAIFCNWLVCLAVVLSTQAKDMGGKYIAIWLPVSTFVSIGFEHSVANMFLLPAGLMSQDTITVGQALTKNLIPVTIGNGLSGALLVGATFSYLFGTLGKPSEACETTAEVKTVDEVMSQWESSASDTLSNVGQGLSALWGGAMAALASANIDEEISAPSTPDSVMEVKATVSSERIAEPTIAKPIVVSEPVPAAFFIDTVATETETEPAKREEAKAPEPSPVDSDFEKMVMDAQREAEEAKLLLLEAEAEAARLEAELAKVAMDEAATPFFEEVEEVEVDLEPVAVMAGAPAAAVISEAVAPAATTTVVETPKAQAPASTTASQPLKNEVEQAPAAATVRAAAKAPASLSSIASSIPPVSRVTRTSNLRDLLK